MTSLFYTFHNVICLHIGSTAVCCQMVKWYRTVSKQIGSASLPDGNIWTVPGAGPVGWGGDQNLDKLQIQK